MKSKIRSLTLLVFLMTSLNAFASKFPTRPIKLIVYTRPGGAIDIFARKFQAVAKKYTDANIVVVNKAGAGGVIAMKYVLKRRADGHTLAAVTKSNIGKLISSKSNLKVDDFNWMAMLVSDPEAIITNNKTAIKSWKQVIEDAKKKNGAQIWLGPATGGNDHVMALKTWRAAGISAKWIPYAGGGKAMAALMGEHGAVYVGNPGDIIGKPDLQVAAISSKTRLTGPFADVPTFNELGIKGLDKEIMWRGFMTKKGIPQEAIDFYSDIFAKVNADKEWIDYIRGRGSDPVFYKSEKFQEIIKEDEADFKLALNKLGVI